MSDRFSLCIVSPNAYGAMAGGTNGSIGGVERQTSLMARWFSAQGYPTSLLTWDEGGPSEEMIDGVRVIKICKQEEGIRGLRFFYPKWTGLIKAMRRANADIYYHNCGECVTGQVAMWARRNRRKFIYSTAYDPDCDIRLPEIKTIRERVLYRYGLRRADRVIAQTQTQQQMLKDHFGLTSEVIAMPCPGPSKEEYRTPSLPPRDQIRILWIGRICLAKRPDYFLELARRCPDLTFDLVGPTNQTSYSTGVAEQAARIPNLTFHGPASRDQVSSFYQRATLLCCTSFYEGFPNTFIEAWSHGLPIVTTFDPDHIIARHRLGVASENLNGVVQGIHQLLQSPDQWNEASQRARQYYLDNHAMEMVMPKFERTFSQVLYDHAS